MDEVVSRRMLYINSNTSMFELTLLYVINRFTTSFAGLTTTLIVWYYMEDIIHFFAKASTI